MAVCRFPVAANPGSSSTPQTPIAAGRRFDDAPSHCGIVHCTRNSILACVFHRPVSYFTSVAFWNQWHEQSRRQGPLSLVSQKDAACSHPANSPPLPQSCPRRRWLRHSAVTCRPSRLSAKGLKRANNSGGVSGNLPATHTSFLFSFMANDQTRLC